MSNSRDLSALFKENNLIKIKQAIENLKDENDLLVQNNSIRKALRNAILANQLEIVRYLLIDEHIDADIRVPIDDEKYSKDKPLIYYAVKSKSLPMVALLVNEARASVRQQGSENNLTNKVGIQTAIEMGETRIAEYLFRQGAEALDIIKLKGPNEEETYLGVAANQQNHAMAELLLKFDTNRENSRYTFISDTIKIHHDRFLERTQRFDKQEKQAEMKDFQASMQFLFDYAMGTNFTTSRGEFNFYDNLEFLRGMDISGFNFLGLSLEGHPITKDMLRSRGFIGADKALTTLDDLKQLQDENRKMIINHNLENAYKTQGKLIKNGVVNLIPLCEAVKENDKDAVKIRLEAGITPNLKYTVGVFPFTGANEVTEPILIAILNGHKDIINLLVNYPTFDQRSLPRAIQLARQLKRIDIADELFAKLKNPSQQNQLGNSLLHLSAITSDIATIKICIKQGVNLDLLNNKGETALAILAGRSESSPTDIDLMQLLLKSKANPNKGDNAAAIHFAAESGNYEALRVLLPFAVKKDYIDSMYIDKHWVKRSVRWDVPLMFDSYPSKDWLKILNLLIEHHANLNQKNVKGETLLTLVCQDFDIDDVRDFSNKLEQIKFLLAHGVNPNIKDTQGNTALHILLEKLSYRTEAPQVIEVIDLFQKNGLNLKDPDIMRGRHNATVLEIAVKKNQKITIEYLLAQNVDVNLPGSKGRTALQWTSKQQPELRNILLTQVLVQDASSCTLDDKLVSEDEVFDFSKYVKKNVLDLSHLKENLRMKGDSFKVTSKLIPHLTAFLNSHPQINSLNFYGNYLGDEIAIALADNTTLTTLNLVVSNISDIGAAALATNKTLVTLDLGANNITDMGAKALAKNTTLKNLALGSNSIGNRGATAFAANKTLEKLDLDRNRVHAEGAKSFAKNSTLEKLIISYNPIGDEGVEAIATNKMIKTLDVRHTQMTNKGAIKLADNKVLRDLNIGFNRIDDRGISALASTTTLKKLGASYINITIDSVAALAANKTFSLLELRKNLIGDEGAILLAANKTLKKLILSENHIKDEGAKAFAINHTLKALDLSDNLIGSRGVEALADNTKLTKLNISGYAKSYDPQILMAFLGNTTLTKLWASNGNSPELQTLIEKRIEKNKASRNNPLARSSLEQSSSENTLNESKTKPVHPISQERDNKSISALIKRQKITGLAADRLRELPNVENHEVDAPSCTLI